MAAGVVAARHFRALERLDQPGKVGEPLAVSAHELLKATALARLVAHELALVALNELAPGHVAEHVEVLDEDGLDVHRARTPAAAVVVGRLRQREATDGGVGFEGGDRPLEPAGLELEGVVDADQIVALDQVIPPVEPAVVAMVVAAVELEATDAAAQVQAHKVGGHLLGSVAREHDQVG